jgi:hypothetical protein
MPCLHIVPSLTGFWEVVVSFLNSSFISAFLSALAGAGLGVWGAQKLAERSTRAKELLESFRQANAITVLATTIFNQALSIKKQHIKPLSDRYFDDRKIAKEINDALLSGRACPKQFVFQAQLTKITPLTLPMDALKSLTYSAHFMPGRALAIVSMIEQSVTELAHVVEVRSEMIDAFHNGSLRPDIFCQDYFGLQRKDGNTNSMYHDTMVAVSQYTDDVAFFSAELADELHIHAVRVSEKLIKLRRAVSKPEPVDFTPARDSGLMPPREDYSSWLSGFRSQD